MAIACWQNKYETAKMLVELGFDLDSTNHNGSTPLHRACYRNNIELVILLTNNGADYNLRDKVIIILSIKFNSIKFIIC